MAIIYDKDRHSDIVQNTRIYNCAFFQDAMSNWFPESEIRILNAEFIPDNMGENLWEGKVNDATKQPQGVQSYRIEYQQNKKNVEQFVITKSKVDDANYLNAISGALEHCGVKPKAKKVYDYMAQLEFNNVNEREVFFYSMQKSETKFKSVPTCYGASLTTNGIEQNCCLILEKLPEESLCFYPYDLSRWDETTIKQALKALAHIHGQTLGKTKTLLNNSLFSNAMNTEKTVRNLDFWQAICESAKNCQLAGLTKLDHNFHQETIDNLSAWYPILDKAEHCLVQNDCSPKNIAICKDKVYFFDWELAVINTPQRDCVEFLAYVLPVEFNENDLLNYINYHHEQLKKITAQSLPKDEWLKTYEYAAKDYLLQRLMLLLSFEQLEKRDVMHVYRNVRRLIEIVS